MSPRAKKKASKRPPARILRARSVMERLRADLAANDPLWLGNDTVDKLRVALVAAQKTLNKQVKDYFDGKSALSEFDAKQMRELSKRLRLAFKQIDGVGEIAAKDKRKLSLEATGAARGDLLRQVAIGRGDLVFDLNITPINLQSAEQMVRKGFVFDKFETSAARYSGWFRQRIESELILASVRNLTIQEAATQLYRRMPGAFQDGQYWAERLVRNEMMNSYGLAHQAYYKQLAQQEPGWKLRWDSARDNRTCPICRSLHDQVVDVANGGEFVAEWTQRKRGKGKAAGTSVGKRLTTKRAPAHVQCRCSVWPWRDGFDEYMKLAERMAAGAAG